MEQSDGPFEVEVRQGFNPFVAAARCLLAFVFATMAYVVVNDHVSEKMSDRVFVVVMVIVLFWPIIMRLLRPLTPLKGFLLSEGTIPLLVLCGLTYKFPSQTRHNTLKIAWAILRAKA